MCECGAIYGEKCQSETPVAELVRVKWVPRHLRDQATAAGGDVMRQAWLLRLSMDCAMRMLDDKDEQPWTRYLADATDPDPEGSGPATW